MMMMVMTRMGGWMDSLVGEMAHVGTRCFFAIWCDSATVMDRLDRSFPVCDESLIANAYPRMSELASAAVALVFDS